MTEHFAKLTNEQQQQSVTAVATAVANTIAAANPAAAAANRREGLTLRVETGQTGQLWTWPTPPRWAFDQAFDLPANEAIKDWMSTVQEFDRSGVDTERFQAAAVEWKSLVTSCKVVVSRIVVRTESPSEAWTALHECLPPDSKRSRVWSYGRGIGGEPDGGHAKAVYRRFYPHDDIERYVLTAGDQRPPRNLGNFISLDPRLIDRTLVAHP